VAHSIQRGLHSVAPFCKRWNIKIKEEKTRAINISHRIIPPESFLTLSGRSFPSVNSISCLVAFDKEYVEIMLSLVL
jgi:hypothetical protein